MRALISIKGMPAAWQALSWFGHNSLSTKHATSGRQCCRKRRTQAGTSSGAKRASTRPCNPISGNRRLSSSCEVTVPVVSNTIVAGASSASTGRIDWVSPTLAACIHSSGPAGRGVASIPRRSASRAATSRPFAARRRRLSRSAGASSVPVSRQPVEASAAVMRDKVAQPVRRQPSIRHRSPAAHPSRSHAAPGSSDRTP